MPIEAKNPTPTVAIVGAGIAGLSAAWQAVRAGYQVEVFEKSERPGGLMKTKTLALPNGQSFVVDVGANWLPMDTRGGKPRPDQIADAYAPLRRMLEQVRHEAGSDPTVKALLDAWNTEVSPIAQTLSQILRDGELHNIQVSTQASLLNVLRFPEHFVAAVHLAKYAAFRYLGGINGLSLEDIRTFAGKLDRETAKAFSLDKFGDKMTTLLTAPMMRALYGAELDELSAAILVWVLLFSEASINGTATFKSGMEYIPRIITTALKAKGVKFHFNHEVETLDDRPDAIAVCAKGQRFDADYVIAAIPNANALIQSRKLQTPQAKFTPTIAMTVFAKDWQVEKNVLLQSIPEDQGGAPGLPRLAVALEEYHGQSSLPAGMSATVLYVYGERAHQLVERSDITADEVFAVVRDDIKKLRGEAYLDAIEKAKSAGYLASVTTQERYAIPKIEPSHASAVANYLDDAVANESRIVGAGQGLNFFGTSPAAASGEIALNVIRTIVEKKQKKQAHNQ